MHGASSVAAMQEGLPMVPRQGRHPANSGLAWKCHVVSDQSNWLTSELPPQFQLQVRLDSQWSPLNL
jgi:hypothetical protein